MAGHTRCIRPMPAAFRRKLNKPYEDQTVHKMNRIGGGKKINQLIESVQQGDSSVQCFGIGIPERAYLVSRLSHEIQRTQVVILPDGKTCEEFAENLSFFDHPKMPEVIFFSPYNILPFKRISYHNETAANRIHTLYDLATNNTPKIVLTPVETLFQRLIPRQVLCDYAELIMHGEEIDRDALVSKLHAGGYRHVTLVEDYGEYSVRGGILDVFSPMYPEPLRIELFGETVDSIRFFSSATQRQIRSIDEAIILPARETILEKSRIPQIVKNVRELSAENNLSPETAAEFIDRIRKEGVFPGIESLLPLVFQNLDTFFDYLPENALWILSDSPGLQRVAEKAEGLAVKNYLNALEDGRPCVEPEKLYLRWDDVKIMVGEKQRLLFQEIRTGGIETPESTDTDLMMQCAVQTNAELSAKLLQGKKDRHILEPLSEWIEEKQSAGFLVFIACSSAPQIKRLQSLLAPYGIYARETAGPMDKVLYHKKGIYLCSGSLSAGFVWADESVAIITDVEIFGAKKHHRRPKKKTGDIKTALLDLGELNAGDLVVHIDHGIGVYKGLEKLRFEGIENDFLLIEYRDGDKLYLPVDHLDMAQKYMGVEGITPVVDKMGGKAWQRVREKAKKSVEKIAGELLALYASRKVIKGHAFTPPDNCFQDFEASFPYEETPDQLKAIEDVLADMEAESPMDRLVCGDVGYGKTEIALRAAFKSVTDNKQVAVLVPTTLLAEQHYQTFSQRFERYPVIVDCLSRFRTRKEQQDILTRLKEGKTDIVIGTHRMVQKDVAFKDLGLAVIDEEQRFGVKHKEKLKKMRKNVDVLSLTATPIPRTLHMSLMGVRDITIIQTPPEHRQAIVSYISEFDPVVAAEAIRKEMQRNGQIFFVHNNINTIWNIAKYLKELVPEVRLAVAHGRLGEEALEKAMFQFLNKEIDLLVCTTIVESGLDIPNANTIIVNRAERYGLAQIYQLRGRVGRSDEQAYAYLFISKEAALTRDAEKRLRVLMEHTGLGAGFQIAMNDLKIRGGGAALGVSQSGHIAAVGYDMFLRLMEDSIRTLKGERVVEKLEPEINIPVSVFIPETYIEDTDQRLMAYRRLAKMNELKEVADFKSELIDRFGNLPTEAGNLLLKIMLKILSVKAGVKKLDVKEDLLFLWFSELHQQQPFAMLELVEKNPGQYQFMPDNGLKVFLEGKGFGRIISQVKNILMDIALCVN